jgi:hypothetical protein
VIGTTPVERDAKEPHPKTMADKLSDKVQVIIAAPGTNGFIGANLIGGQPQRDQP